MTKYGFDYLTQRTEVLTEMARPSPWSGLGGGAGDAVKEYFDNANRILRKGGVTSSGEKVIGYGGNREKSKNLKFFVYTMSRLDEEPDDREEEISDDASKHELVNRSVKILGISPDYKSEGYSDVDKLYRAAIKKLIETEPEYLLSPEFKEKITNVDNILTFSRDNRYPTGASHATAAKRAEIYGMSPEEIDTIQSRSGDIDNIIKKIKREQAVRKNKFIHMAKKGEKYSPKEETPEVTGENKYIDNINIIYDALEILTYNTGVIKQKIEPIINNMIKKYPKTMTKESLMGIIDDVIDSTYPEGSSEYNHEYIKTLYLNNNIFYNSIINDLQDIKETGISMYDFLDIIEKLKQKYSNNSNILKLIQYFTTEIDELYKAIEHVSMVDDENKQYDPYSGIDKDIIHKYAKTPEELDQVNKFFEVEAIERKNRQRNVEAKMLKNEVNSAADKFLMDKKVERINNLISKTRTEISNLENQSNPDDPNNESYIMSYMTEQINKDKFKPRGEFKERGFKKAKNYWEGKTLL